jgi:predicted naringenin-chalcone synthase
MKTESLCFISNFKSPKPKHYVSQENGKEWIRMAYGRTLSINDNPEIEKLDHFVDKYTVKSDQIQRRGTELTDFTKDNLEENEIFYFRDKYLGAPLNERMSFYSKSVQKRASEVFHKEQEKPKHIIHTSCTGYLSPSPIQRMCEDYAWYDTEITHAYHMGCYASMPTVRMAAGLANQVESVDIFHSELCTLHFTTENFTAEQLVVQSLFADGYSSYSVTKEQPKNKKSFKVLGVAEMRVQNSLDDMIWIPSHSQFDMKISKEVPLKLAMEVHEGLFKLFDKAGFKKEDHESLMKEAIFAIHPGGPKILDQIQMLLQVEESQIEDARRVLKENGNMSSATLPQIWESIQDKDLKQGQIIVSLAFGPGLTMFGSVMQFQEKV